MGDLAAARGHLSPNRPACTRDAQRGADPEPEPMYEVLTRCTCTAGQGPRVGARQPGGIRSATGEWLLASTLGQRQLAGRDEVRDLLIEARLDLATAGNHLDPIRRGTRLRATGRPRPRRSSACTRGAPQDWRDIWLTSTISSVSWPVAGRGRPCGAGTPADVVPALRGSSPRQVSPQSNCPDYRVRLQSAVQVGRQCIRLDAAEASPWAPAP